MATNLDLSLARQALPQEDWQRDHTGVFYVDEVVWRAKKELTRDECRVYFEPEGAHFAEVLAWLLGQRKDGPEPCQAEWYSVTSFDVLKEETFLGCTEEDSPVWAEEHDGTVAGIRAAVHRAALRVLK